MRPYHILLLGIVGCCAACAFVGWRFIGSTLASTMSISRIISVYELDSENIVVWTANGETCVYARDGGNRKCENGWFIPGRQVPLTNPHFEIPDGAIVLKDGKRCFAVREYGSSELWYLSLSSVWAKVAPKMENRAAAHTAVSCSIDGTSETIIYFISDGRPEPLQFVIERTAGGKLVSRHEMSSTLKFEGKSYVDCIPIGHLSDELILVNATASPQPAGSFGETLLVSDEGIVISVGPPPLDLGRPISFGYQEARQRYYIAYAGGVLTYEKGMWRQFKYIGLGTDLPVYAGTFTLSDQLIVFDAAGKMYELSPQEVN